MTEQHPFTWRHVQPDLIVLCVRWYVRSALSYRDVEELMAQRGLRVDHPTRDRGVQEEAPECDHRCRPPLKACTDSWKVDETSMKSNPVGMDLSRAVDAEGNPLEVLVSPPRDAEAAKGFCLNALQRPASSASQTSEVTE